MAYLKCSSKLKNGLGWSIDSQDEAFTKRTNYEFSRIKSEWSTRHPRKAEWHELESTTNIITHNRARIVKTADFMNFKNSKLRLEVKTDIFEIVLCHL